MGLLFVSTQPIYAQESPAFKKIRDVWPDGKFAVRISCSSQPEDPGIDRRGSYERRAKARDDGVKMYLPFAPNADQERYRLQFLCDLTDEEIREVEQSKLEGKY